MYFCLRKEIDPVIETLCLFVIFGSPGVGYVCWEVTEKRIPRRIFGSRRKSQKGGENCPIRRFVIYANHQLGGWDRSHMTRIGQVKNTYKFGVCNPEDSDRMCLWVTSLHETVTLSFEDVNLICLKIQVLRDVTPCRLVNSYRRFESIALLSFLGLKSPVGNYYLSTRHNTLEDVSL
jgi:hypothetical protein